MAGTEVVKGRRRLIIKNLRKFDEQPSDYVCKYIRCGNEYLYAYIDIEKRILDPDILMFNIKLAKANDELNKVWLDDFRMPTSSSRGLNIYIR